jgi:hypothetical protein
VPKTFILPAEYQDFVRYYNSKNSNENSEQLWILKPCDKSRGMGISVIRSLEDIPDQTPAYQPLNTSSSSSDVLSAMDVVDDNGGAKTTKSYSCSWSRYVVASMCMDPVTVLCSVECK